MPPLSAVDDIAAGRGPSWLDSWLEAHRAQVVAWRRHIHAHPELGHTEDATTSLVAGEVARAGLRPTLLPGGTGLICDIGTGDRCIALRADIDALPLREATGLSFASTLDGVAHACGHDAHTAILLGAALALASAPSLPGRVRLIFQPAEEVLPGGALDVLAAGGLSGVDRIFALHCDPRLPTGRIGTRVGSITSAADLLELRLSSPGGHTSRPHLTADLVHALGTVITGLPGLLSRRVDPRSGTVLVWGAVQAGHAPNTVPQDGVLRGTLRTADRDTWGELERLVCDLVGSLLDPTGVGYELEHTRGVPPVVNESTSTRLLQEAVGSGAGEAALSGVEQSSGGEDFGWYLEQVPGSLARLGVWPGHGPQRDLHQPTFDLDERALPLGVRVMVHTALAALT
ncbi:MAG: amidohydrolase [Pseudonocardiaceae bacterium]|nr:amidohydrolase [Pseudonocardiaceae bacterium]